MPISMNNNMMREIILDHYGSPRFKKTPADLKDFRQIYKDSDSCIDKIHVYIKVENDIVTEAYFDGVGCAISTASTDIMCDLITGKKLADVEDILKNYNNMIHEHEYNEDVLEEANAFCNTYKQPARIKCATIGWDGLEEIIK